MDTSQAACRLIAAAGLTVIALVFSPVRPDAASAQIQPRVAVTLFTEPKAGDGPVLSLLNSAKKSIKLEIYEITDADEIDALGAAVRRNVEVRVLLEQHPLGLSKYATKAYSELRRDGVSVKWANEGAYTYTHEKAVEVDGSVVGIFTFNFSYSAFESNREFGVIDNNGADAARIEAIFDADWARKPPRVQLGDLVVSPINARSRITGLIDHAKKSLDLYEEEIEDSTIESHLSKAVKRGVKVRLITSDDSSGVERLKAAGVKVAIMSTPYVHAKAMVADGEVMFVGSENISSTSLDSNREMGIVLSDPTSVKSVESTFNSDWAANGGETPPSKPGGKLTLLVTAYPQTVARYQLMTITAATEAGASCRITVTYPDGYVSHAGALEGSKTVGSTGRVSWEWHVGSTATGKAHASVTCAAGSSAKSKTVAFEITS